MKANLAAVIVLLLGATLWFLISREPAQTNTALVDTATTNAVETQVKAAIQDSFSYDYTNTARTEQAARAALTGNAFQQYEQLFGKVRSQAAAQKLVLVSTVRSIAVSSLVGDRADLLVFLDQQSVRTADNQNTSLTAQLAVTARKVGNGWEVTELDVL